MEIVFFQVHVYLTLKTNLGINIFGGYGHFFMIGIMKQDTVLHCSVVFYFCNFIFIVWSCCDAHGRKLNVLNFGARCTWFPRWLDPHPAFVSLLADCHPAVVTLFACSSPCFCILLA